MMRRISIAEVQRVVADDYDVTINDLISRRRARAIIIPRFAAMFLAKELTPSSYPMIARRFGDRDHTSVCHAVVSLDQKRRADPELDARLQRLARRIRGEPEPGTGREIQLSFLHGPLFDLGGALAA